MYCIIICGGGGKTTLYQKYPNLFLDIDDFIWNHESQKQRDILQQYVEDGNIECIGNFYRSTMRHNELLRNDSRIILCHRPENALDLNRKIICICRPNKKLHEKNIETRSNILKKFANNDWHSLNTYKPYEYDNYNDFNNFIFNCVMSIKNQN